MSSLSWTIAAALCLAAGGLAPRPAAAQSDIGGVLNPEEGGVGSLDWAISNRPDRLGVTCWMVYEVQKGGQHSTTMDIMRACAEAGNEPSMILMSHAYENGLGVPRDPERAALWVKRAAELGYSTAQVHYARALLTGEGVPRDEGQARFWLMQAERQGDSDAADLLATLAPMS